MLEFTTNPAQLKVMKTNGNEPLYVEILQIKHGFTYIYLWTSDLLDTYGHSEYMNVTVTVRHRHNLYQMFDCPYGAFMMQSFENINNWDVLGPYCGLTSNDPFNGFPLNLVMQSSSYFYFYAFPKLSDVIIRLEIQPTLCKSVLHTCQRMSMDR